MAAFPSPGKLSLLNHHLSGRMPGIPATSPAAASTLSRRYEHLSRSEKYTDCVFHVADSSFKCHKLILSAASPVFEAMFYGPLRESAGIIDIVDISDNIFKVLVRYIYAGLVDYEQLSLEQTIELYYSAEKYLITELIEDCVIALTRKLRFSNILPALELSLCIDLRGLLDVCMSFFMRCCLSDPQYMVHLRANYQHVSKECIKAIIASNKEMRMQLLWFVYEWCQHECNIQGLPKCDYSVIFEDLQLKTHADPAQVKMMQQQMQEYSNWIERSFFKACRPFTIEQGASAWKVIVKCDRFILLRGLIMHSRLAPGRLVQRHQQWTFLSEYKESLLVEICPAVEQNTAQPPPQNMRSVGAAPSASHQAQLLPGPSPIIFRYTVSQQATKYSCDLNICWKEGVILSPEVAYEVKLTWGADACGAEYPCTVMSNVVDGIHFKDFDVYSGSIVKGLHFVNLL